VVWRHGRCELWHYRNDSIRVTPPLLIVFSLISSGYILDLSPGNSFIERLLAAGSPTGWSWAATRCTWPG
jgi:polyhydroxyalkanoate synthase subunit PhaC